MSRPNFFGPCRTWLPALLLTCLPVQAQAAVDRPEGFIPWPGRDGQILPFSSDEEVLDFLRTARVVSRKRLSVGINKPYKVLLERDSIQVNAVFRDVRSESNQAQIRGTARLQFRDDAMFEVAAYELSRLLGLRIVPPTVARTIGGRTGSLQLWVEGAMTETRRREEQRTSPRPLEWARASQIRYIFDELIHNDDRNLGNILIDSDWKVWLIDHTRCFHPYSRIYEYDRLTHISVGFWEALNQVPAEEVQTRLADYLTKRQIESLLKRWQLLVEHYEQQIEEYGPARVLFEE